MFEPSEEDGFSLPMKRYVSGIVLFLIKVIGILTYVAFMRTWNLHGCWVMGGGVCPYVGHTFINMNRLKTFNYDIKADGQGFSFLTKEKINLNWWEIYVYLCIYIILECIVVNAVFELLADMVYSFLQLIEFGIEGSIIVLQTCFHHLNCHRTELRDLKNTQLDPVFGSLFKYILDKPNFSTVFCQSIGSATISEGFLESLSNALKLSASEKIGIGLALSDSEDSGIRMCGKFQFHEAFT